MQEETREICDIYNQDKQPTGKTIQRGSRLAEGQYRLVVHACIFNARGQMLIQKRQPFKKGWPGLWDITVGGAAMAGESSQAAIQRELIEEIGYVTDLSRERPYLTIHFNNGFDDIYILHSDISLDALVLQTDEVELVAWADKQEVLNKLEQGNFVPYEQGLIELLFTMEQKRGVHKMGRG